MKKVKTLFISDVHLGTKKCQADKLLELFKNLIFVFGIISWIILAMSIIFKLLSFLPIFIIDILSLFFLLLIVYCTLVDM